MDENLDHIEDLFYSVLNHHEEIPSKNVWDKVERELDKEKLITINRKYVVLRRVTVVLFVFLLLAIFELSNMNTFYSFKEKSNRDAIFKKHLAEPDRKLSQKGHKNEHIASLAKHITTLAKDKNAANDFAHTQNNYKISLSEMTHVAKEENIKMTGNNPLPVGSSSTIKTINATGPEKAQQLEETVMQKYLTETPVGLTFKRINVDPKESISIQSPVEMNSGSQSQRINYKKNNSAQSIQEKETTVSRLSVNAFFSPDVAWYLLHDKNTNNQYVNAREIERDEKHAFSSDYGFVIDYHIRKNWSLLSGIIICNTNINAEPGVIYAQPDNVGKLEYRINTSSGYGFILPSYSTNPRLGDSLYVVTLSHSLKYLNVPAAFNFDVFTGKFIFSLNAGLSANFLIKSKLRTSVEDGRDNSIENVNYLLGVKKIYFAGLVGVKAAYRLTRRASLIFAPTFHFALNSINKDAAVKSYPKYFGPSIGLNLGL